MRRIVRFLFAAVAVAAVLVACGSRTGLLLDEPPDVDASDDLTRDGRAEASADASNDASRDATVDARADARADARPDGPLFEGGALDAKPECTAPAYCDPADRGYIYRCGLRIFQCSSVEQCHDGNVDGGGADSGAPAACVNPCVDTLGQDTSNGCEFYAIEMDVVDTVAGACYAVFVVNQWQSGEPARLQVDRGGAPLPIEQFARIPVGTGTNITYTAYSEARGLAKGEVAVLFLSRDPAALTNGDPIDPRRLASCPANVTPAFVGDAAQHGTGRGTAFHITANVPVVAYQAMPFGGGRARATSASLLPPTNVWDTNYVAVNAAPATSTSPTTLAIVGSANGTQVRIRPTHDIVGGGGLAASRAGVSEIYTVNRGEYVQFTQTEELTGSAIEATGPVAVLGGNTLMIRPSNRTQRADTAHQMLPPIRSLGNEYALVRYRSRARPPLAEESVPWRLVGVVNGTTLTYEPSRPLGAPSTLSAGQMAEFDSPGPLVVRSQGATHPFYLAAYMTGGDPYDGEGDPEFVNVIAPAQYLPRYTFFTDPTYPETNLVVVRVKDATVNRFPEVRLVDCAGTLSGWAPVGTGGRYEFTRIDLSTGNFRGQNGCDNGVHNLEATLTGAPAGTVPRIGLAVWGWGNPVTYAPLTPESDPRFTRWVSYGYPGGANFTRLNSVLFPAN